MKYKYTMAVQVKGLLLMMLCQCINLIRAAQISFTYGGLQYWRWFAWHVEVGQILISNLY